MNQTLRTSYAERLKTAAEARKAMLGKFQPKTAIPAPEPVDRAARKAAELVLVREARAEAKAARKEAALQAARDVREAEEAIAAAALAVKRGARKERKALTKAEAKAKRDARYAARKARN